MSMPLSPKYNFMYFSPSCRIARITVCSTIFPSVPLMVTVCCNVLFRNTEIGSCASRPNVELIRNTSSYRPIFGETQLVYRTGTFLRGQLLQRKFNLFAGLRLRQFQTGPAPVRCLLLLRCLSDCEAPYTPLPLCQAASPWQRNVTGSSRCLQHSA